MLSVQRKVGDGMDPFSGGSPRLSLHVVGHIVSRKTSKSSEVGETLLLILAIPVVTYQFRTISRCQRGLGQVTIRDGSLACHEVTQVTHGSRANAASWRRFDGDRISRL